MQSYRFLYLDLQGLSLTAGGAECADDAEAHEQAVVLRPATAAAVEIWCENRVVAKLRLDNLSNGAG